MQTFHYHFLKTNKELAQLADALRKIFVDTADTMLSRTEVVETDVVVRHSQSNTIPELGISGQYTKDASCIDIYLDLDNSHLTNDLESAVARTFTHEYMHALREKYIPWESGTLLDSLIAEGLTQSFEVELQPEAGPPIYATVCTESELDALWERAKNVLDQRGWSNEEWFFGSDNIKKWSGYALGYKLVQDKIKKSGLPASALYTLPSTDFLPED